MYYIKYNGIDLTNIIKVKEVEIPSLPSIEHSSINVFERDGNIYNGASYGNRNIKMTFIIKPDNPDDYDIYINDVKRAFYTKKECKLYCGNEELYIWCVPIDEIMITELGYGCSEAEINLIAYDPYWYSSKAKSVNNGGKTSFLVENTSDIKTYPIIDVGFTKDTTFFQIENQANGQRILVGGIPTIEGSTINKDSVLFTDNMRSTEGWTNSSAPISSGRSTGGTISTTSTGDGIMCGNFGSASSGSSWHGCCYKKSLDKAVKDFKVKARMSHNSTGISGDPEHPYVNDEDTVISGTKTINYLTVTDVELLNEASLTSTKMRTIPPGVKLVPLETANGWVKVTYDGKTGYCYTKYLKEVVIDSTLTTKECNYVTTKSTAIRVTADENSTSLITIPAGAIIRVNIEKKYPLPGTTESGSSIEKFYKLAKEYQGCMGYVLIEDIVEANQYTVEYDYPLNTSDDKTGIVELYGFSSNNIQLFRMGLYDDNTYWEFTYPVIRKNNEDFLIDKTVAPSPKTLTSYKNDGQSIERILSGSYGDWNKFYGELYIERVNDKWSAYVQKIEDGKIVKTIKSKTIVDTTNTSEELSYLVIYIGTAGTAEKASGMSISNIEVKTATAINDTTIYNFQEFKAGDILTIDNNIPEARLNGVECNELVDVGSSFFPLESGENIIKFNSDDNPSVDIVWNNRYL